MGSQLDLASHFTTYHLHLHPNPQTNREKLNVMLILNQPKTSSQATILITEIAEVPLTNGSTGRLVKGVSKDKVSFATLDNLPDCKAGDILDIFVVTGDRENPHDAGNYYIETCVPAPQDFFNS